MRSGSSPTRPSDLLPPTLCRQRFVLKKLFVVLLNPLDGEPSERKVLRENRLWKMRIVGSVCPQFPSVRNIHVGTLCPRLQSCAS